jgi:hypothetical protein
VSEDEMGLAVNITALVAGLLILASLAYVSIYQ